MPYLTNTWVGYLKRSAQQILDACLTELGARVPEMSDHSPNNPYVRNLEQFAGIHEQLGYYIDNVARETFLTEARLYKSLIAKAREYDYQVIGNLPYTTDVQFSIDVVSPTVITIPADTIISDEDGSIRYRTLGVATIGIGSLVSNIVGAVQSEKITGQIVQTSTGAADLEISFPDKIVHNSIIAKWNSIAWNNKSTLAYSSPIATDFVQTVDTEGKTMIYFGNAMPTGAIPPSGQVLTVDYEYTLGADGKVGINELDKVVSTIPSLPSGYDLHVRNIAQSVGGSNVESMEDLRRHIPIANRTLQRAVTLSDFETLITLTPGVASAGAEYHGRKKVDIFIYPIGGGVASTTLIANAQAFINERRVIGTNPVVQAAGEIHILLTLEVTAKSNYANVDVHSRVMTALTDFMSYKTQKIRGTVNLSDLYEVVENTEGVDHSNIRVFTAVPYARPLTPTSPPLIWTPVPIPNAMPTQLWRIIFITGTSFRLLQGSSVFGTFSTGVPVATPSLQFTIPAGAYSSGNSYEYYTYSYSGGGITVVEPSLPVSAITDITLTVTGGY